jgi:acyl-coenzyme A thioesterase PaaI-like protein
MSERAFQDQGSVHHCHGCGAANEKGLRLKSFWDGEEAVATWKAEPHHCGGSPETLNGGIIASLIDCHCLNLAIAHAYRTDSLNVSYLRPTPLHESIELRARIAKLEGRKAWVSCTLRAAREVRATGEVLGLRVEWK